jgi:hypothetical protein
MKSTETLRHLKECYELFHPADENTDEAFIWFSKIPHPFFNAVMHLGPEGNFQAKIDQIIQKVPLDLPYSIWVLSDPKYAKISSYLEEKHFSPALTCSLMRWSVESIPLPDADIRIADPASFHTILAAVYHFDEAVKKGFSDLLEKGRCENILLYVGGKPVSTGSLILCGYYGAIFNEAALSGYEDKSPALIQHIMQRAYTLRMQQLVVLSAPEYEKIYLDLGFEKTGEIVLYVPSFNKSIK